MAPLVLIYGEAEKYGNYQRAVEDAGGRVRFGTDATDCDALLLPGGGDVEPARYGQDNAAAFDLDPQRDAAEWALLESFVAAGKPVLGICRGMQVVNVFFGGTLLQNVQGHTAQKNGDSYHSVRTSDSPLYQLYGEKIIVNSAHHQAVDQLGDGLQAVQWAPDGVTEAVCHQQLPIWAVQWHPERLRGGAGGIPLMEAFLQLCQEPGRPE